MSEEKIRELLKESKELYDSGMREMATEPQKACEAVWGSVERAARALTLRYLGKELSTSSAVEEALRKAGVTGAELKELREIFDDSREWLHGSCFYGASFKEDVHPPFARERVPVFLNTVRSLLGLGFESVTETEVEHE
jgi:hypothetical protein